MNFVTASEWLSTLHPEICGSRKRRGHFSEINFVEPINGGRVQICRPVDIAQFKEIETTFGARAAATALATDEHRRLPVRRALATNSRPPA